MAKTERFQLMLSPQEIARIDDWRFANRVRSRAEALRRLVDKGLAALGPREDDDGAVIGTRTPSSSANPAGVEAPASSHNG